VKFNLPLPAPRPPVDSSLQIGNVYRCKGGGKTHYWIVIGLTERTVNLVGINSDGAITSTANYGAHVFEGHVGFSGRELLGRCTGVADMEFDIEWIGGGTE
jgi:hypothetical protein